MTNVARRKDVVRLRAREISYRCVGQYVQHEDEQLDEATTEQYHKAWSEGSAWCRRHGLGPYHPAPIQTRRWAEHLLGQNLTPSTIEERLTGVAWCHSKTKQQTPVGLRSAGQPIAAAAWRRSDAARTAAPISLAALRHITEEIPQVLNKPADDPRVIRDRCLLTLGWAAARLAPELVALDVDDLAFIDDCNGERALLHFKPPPSERLIAGLIVYLASSDHPESCPVRTSRRQAEHRRSGPLFIEINESGNETKSGWMRTSSARSSSTTPSTFSARTPTTTRRTVSEPGSSNTRESRECPSAKSSKRRRTATPEP